MKVIQSTATVLILALTCALHSLNGLTLSNKEGTAIDVAVLEIEATRIQIRLQNGSTTWLDRDRLSTDSHQAIIDLAKQEQSRFQIINELLGISLLKDNNLWDDAPDDVAQRLRLAPRIKHQHPIQLSILPACRLPYSRNAPIFLSYLWSRQSSCFN